MGGVSVQENLERVQERIQAALRRAGRTDGVTLVGVSKFVSAARMAESYRWGLRHFGENRVQEFDRKRADLDLPEAVWHLVGHLQSNKARRAAEIFDCIDSLDSPRLAEKLATSVAQRRVLPVLIQVDVGDEASKHGVAPGKLLELVEGIAGFEALSIRGLMAIPPFLDSSEEVRPFFRRLRELRDEVARRGIAGVEMAELSMGMSHDFEVAIEEGATQVRVGTAIFGERRQP